MLFNSLEYTLFLPIVFILYWFATNNSIKYQNLLLLVASYYFYSCWDFRFLFLLIFSTLLDYYTGIKVARSSNISVRKFWLWLSIIINLGFLGVFKYYNFFIGSFTDGLDKIGIETNFNIIEIILPVGISFYTFHGLSYVIDAYKKRIEPIRNFVDYSVFVSFFPLLVAGPIERATHLLPQIQQKRIFDYTKTVDGLRQILWGLFKKIVIADNCAEYANLIFNNYENYPASTLVIGVFFFSIQIYGDFSGYSDIALGTARLLGIELLQNFSFPYFSRDIAEFWRRWHISLSSWFRDYIYIPLGGSKGNLTKKIRNTFIIFLLSGFWHGANWTFITWGGLNAIYFLPLLILKRNRNNISIASAGKYFPSIKEILQISITFGLINFAWIFFRAENMTQAICFIGKLFSFSIFSLPNIFPVGIFVLIILFFLIEWLGREQKYAIANLGLKWPRSIRWLFYYTIIILIVLYAGNNQEFIYFQF